MFLNSTSPLSPAAPKYKGRTKKRKKLLITNVDSDSGSESSSTVSSSNNNKSPNKSDLRVRLNPSRKSPRISDSQHERDFLYKLYQFMKMRKTPIGKVPTIGFKEREYLAAYGGRIFNKHWDSFQLLSWKTYFLLKRKILWSWIYEKLHEVGTLALGSSWSWNIKTLLKAHFQSFWPNWLFTFIISSYEI